MLIKIAHPHPIKSSEITAEAIYADRRHFLRQIGLATAGAALAGYGRAEPVAADANLAPLTVVRKSEMAGGENVTAYTDITHYNNFYEFGSAKKDPARNASRLRTRPWSVVVDGECETRGRIDLDDLIKPQALEERIYRHRCVEAWSMVAPWVGFPRLSRVETSP
jgi:sulfoxide reductase catalytic subunit YedY